MLIYDMTNKLYTSLQLLFSISIIQQSDVPTPPITTNTGGL